MVYGKAAARTSAGASTTLLGRSRTFSTASSFRLGHLTEDALALYGTNRLPDAAVPPVLKHLLCCERCFDRMLGVATLAFVRMLRNATGALYGNRG